MGHTTIPRGAVRGLENRRSRNTLRVDPVSTALVTIIMARQNLEALGNHTMNDDVAYCQLFKTRKSLDFLIDAMKGESHPAALELSSLLERISTSIAFKFAENRRDFATEDTALQAVETLMNSNCL